MPSITAPLRLTLRQLQVFVAVAEYGSTAAAAQWLALSQSATSAALNELERMLDLRLFDRMGKRLVINESGRALLPTARTMLDDAHGIEALRHDPRSAAPHLRIGASSTLGNHVLPDILHTYLGSQPSTHAPWQTRVLIDNTACVARAVAESRLDIGLIEGFCHEANVCVHPWLVDELIVVASPALAQRLCTPQPPDAHMLAQTPWLLREPGSGTREVTDQALLPWLHVRSRSLELGDSQAIAACAALGMGLACLSRWTVARTLQTGELQIVPTPWPTVRRQCHWITHRNKTPTPALERFIHLLQERQRATAAHE